MNGPSWICYQTFSLFPPPPKISTKQVGDRKIATHHDRNIIGRCRNRAIVSDHTWNVFDVKIYVNGWIMELRREKVYHAGVRRFFLDLTVSPAYVSELSEYLYVGAKCICPSLKPLNTLPASLSIFNCTSIYIYSDKNILKIYIFSIKLVSCEEFYLIFLEKDVPIIILQKSPGFFIAQGYPIIQISKPQYSTAVIVNWLFLLKVAFIASLKIIVVDKMIWHVYLMLMYKS